MLVFSHTSIEIGNGGQGGNGGNGGNGAPGIRGRDPGGPGGDGGNAGNGGDAGNGGNAGDGGRITFEAVDPSLFMLVDAVTTAGIPGRAGKAGASGSPGAGGPGGHSRSGSNTGYIPPGRPGRAGNVGRQGRGARIGNTGNPGYAEFVLYDNFGNILEIGNKYDIVVESFAVQNILEDQIFEPLQEVVITEVVLCNQGKITLPQGATYFMESLTGDFTVIEPSKFMLPGIGPGQTVVVNPNLHLRLKDFPTPRGGTISLYSLHLLMCVHLKTFLFMIVHFYSFSSIWLLSIGGPLKASACVSSC